MHTMPAPTVRLLLLKSGAGSGAKIANMPGFAFWGGRWHKVAHDKPAPKHAPLAHHPKAAGHFEPVAHLTQDQWDALKLPESNTNAPTFNKQLQTVKELSESGNVTALLGLGVGSNTYGVKLSKIINHLLGLHGSPHAVSPGQKAGTHAATLNADPAAPHPSGLPDHIAPKADSSDPAVNAASQTVTKNQASGVLDNLPGSTNFFSDGASIEGVFQKAEKSHNELLVQHESGVPSVVDVDLDQIVITQPLIQKNKVLAYFDKSTTPPPVPGVVTDGGKVAIVDGHHRLMAAKLKGQKSIKVSLVTPPASSNNDKAELGKLEAAQAGATGQLAMPAFEEGKTTTGVVDYYTAQAQKVMGMAAAGDVSGLEAMKADGMKPNAKGKVSNTWAGKTANSKKLLALHAAALAHAGGGAPAVAPEPVVPAAPAAQPEPTPSPRLVLPKKASAVPAAAHPEPDTITVPEKLGKVGPTTFKPAPDFKDYAEAQAWIAARAKALGMSKASFQSSYEYAHAMPKLQAAYAPAKADYDAKMADKKAEALASMSDAGVKLGDTVAWNSVGAFLSQTKYEGTVVMHGGLPHVKLAHKTTVSKGGKLVHTNYLLWQPHMKPKGVAVAPTPKEGDTKPAADGGTLVLKDGHWVKQGGDAAPVAQTTQAAPAAQPADTGPLTAEQLANLQSIPWYKLKLPDSNSNAKSHNAAVAKIEAMAFAGDVAGLKAFADKKAGAKQVYTKKQHLLAMSALDFLNGNGPTAEQKVRAAKVAAQPEPGGEPASLAGKPALEHIKTHFEPGDFGWSQKSPDSVVEADAAKWVDQNPADAEDMVSALVDVGASDLAKKFKYSPPAAPAPQPVADQAAADSVPAYPKKMIDDYAASGDWSGVQMIIDNSPSPSVVAYAKQVLAGKPAPKPTRLVAKPAPSQAIPSNGPEAADALEKLENDIGSAGSATEAIKITGKYVVNSGFTAAAYSDASDALLAHGYSEASKNFAANSKAAFDASPKEGDTKQGADGMLVLKNGHWVKVGGDQPSAKAIVATVPMPKLGGGTGKVKYTQKMKELKAIAEQEGAAGLSKVVSITSLGGVKIKGYKMINPNGSVFGKNAEAMAQYAKALHEAVVGAGAVGTPAAAPTPAPAAPTTPPTVNGLPSMDNWVKTGPQGGSNPGGKFKDPSGQEWYCKFPKDSDTAKSEVLAAKLYALAGLSAQDCMLVTRNGEVGIASKWVDLKKADNPKSLAKIPGVLNGFAVDAWLCNRDVVGESLDNLLIGSDGSAHRVDAGGSLEYRAQGGFKVGLVSAPPFGPSVVEIDRMRDPFWNKKAAAVFGGMTDADITASVAKVLAISDVAIRAMVNQHGPGDEAAKKKMAETLIARKQDLLKRYPEAAKKKKAPTFKPEEISAPPSFLNWGGSGKSGPSSKEFLNKANEDAVQAIFAAAKTGDVEAVKKLTAPVFDKGTGAVTGQQSVLYHPSQHVSGYAQQAINELNYQLNPPKQFMFDGGHPLHSLNAAYPSHKGAPSSAAAQKLGKFIMLGEPGVIALADLALPAKITHAEGGGTLSVHTYAKQAQAAIAKMPATQKQAVKSYTGNSYHAMNGSLWDGNPTGAAKAAGEALHTLGHDIEPGTILSRHLSLHGKDLNDILGSVGKVLQEPAIMSTSIRPSSWIRNVQFKLHVGPGVKGLWVGYNSLPGGEALSKNAGEDEMVLPPGTRLLVLSVRKGGKDADGFGAHGQQHVIEAIILPTE